MNEKVSDHKKKNLFMSLKKYSADEYEKAVGRVMFPNYKRYHNLNKECNDFFQKLI